jgi:hypothetical protein
MSSIKVGGDSLAPGLKGNLPRNTSKRGSLSKSHLWRREAICAWTHPLSNKIDNSIIGRNDRYKLMCKYFPTKQSAKKAVQLPQTSSMLSILR